VNELKPKLWRRYILLQQEILWRLFSASYLKDSKFFNGGLEQLAMARYYYLYMGAMLPLDREEKIKLSPSFLFVHRREHHLMQI
jgi:hypothetical protein